ncbi:MAG: extracellular solute-binding protein [Oscillospiraceae bacterium]|nr:extracellular solute-binding protein [Oscillospiraceae bacterium]
MKRRLIVYLLCLCMLLSLMAGCGASGDTASSVTAEPSSTEANEASAEPAAEVEAAPAEASTADPEEAVEASAAEPEEASAPEEARPTISYPIDGNPTLTITFAPPPYIADLLQGEPFNTMPCLAALQENTGVTLDYTIYERLNYEDKSSLMIATGDYPDIFGAGFGSGYSHGSWKLVEDDIVIELTDLIPEYAPDYQALLDSDPEFYSLATTEDRVVEIFGKQIPNARSGLCIRQDWFDALGLSVPTTLDELTDVLRAIHSEYNPKMTLLVNSGLESGLEYTFGFVNALNYLSFQHDADGNLICVEAGDAFVDYLSQLHDYYEEGFFSDDFLSISRDNNNYDSTFLEGNCGVFSCGTDFLNPTNWHQSGDDTFAITAISDITMDGTVGSHVGGGGDMRESEGYCISTSCSNPEAALEFFNYCFTEEGQYLINYGIEGQAHEVDENGVIHWTELITNNPDGLDQNKANTLYVKTFLPTIQSQRSMELKYSSETEMNAALDWASHRDTAWTMPTNLEFTSEEQDTINRYASDLSTMFLENMPKVVLGDITVDGYRDVIQAAYDEMHLQDLIDVYTAAYARYAGE